MKKNNKTVLGAIMFLMVLMTALSPCPSNAQEVFPDRTPSQEFLQNRNAPGGMLRAGGGTGSDDPFNPGGGTDPNGNQNDTAVPVTDALWSLCLLAVGYGLHRRKQVSTEKFSDKEN